MPAPSPLTKPHYDLFFGHFAIRNTATYSSPVLPAQPGDMADWQVLLRLIGILARRRRGRPEGDVEAIVAAYTPDGSYQDSGVRQPVTGHAQLRTFYAAFSNRCPTTRATSMARHSARTPPWCGGEQPPHGVYRMKGTVAIGRRHYLVNVVGTSVNVVTAPAGAAAGHLVAIGTHLDSEDVRARLEVALRPAPEKLSAAAGMRRLQRLRQYSI